MALIPTPDLNQDIYNALVKIFGNMFSGDGITEGNIKTDPQERLQRVCKAGATDITDAIEKWLIAVQFIVTPGSLHTIGSPTAQTNADTGKIEKL